ncbi:hypothetical protein HY745_07515 [Candidatus Desantisbacteria bacterium]|nr:hypothetical protein [Candidatus Desantisbacteria bacterium]
MLNNHNKSRNSFNLTLFFFRNNFLNWMTACVVIASTLWLASCSSGGKGGTESKIQNSDNTDISDSTNNSGSGKKGDPVSDTKRLSTLDAIEAEL